MNLRQEILGTLHYTGSCLGQAFFHPGRQITHCSAELDKPESPIPWWGLAGMTVAGAIFMTIAQIWKIEAVGQVGRTLADGGVFLLFGRGHEVYQTNRKRR